MGFFQLFVALLSGLGQGLGTLGPVTGIFIVCPDIQGQDSFVGSFDPDFSLPGLDGSPLLGDVDFSDKVHTSGAELRIIDFTCKYEFIAFCGNGGFTE